MSAPVVIVTGGASGIGRAICQRFADEGYRVVVADTRTEPRDGGTPTHTLIEQDGGTALHVAADVRDRDDMDDMSSTVHDRFGRIDVIVNNAGVLHQGSVLGLDEDDWQHTLDVNLTGVFHGTKAVLPYMADGGDIVNISSGLGKQGLGGYAAYCASKFGVIGFTEAVAQDLKARIQVNAVCPGMTKTAMTDFSGEPPARVADTVYEVVQGDYTGRAVDVR